MVDVVDDDNVAVVAIAVVVVAAAAAALAVVTLLSYPLKSTLGTIDLKKIGTKFT